MSGPSFAASRLAASRCGTQQQRAGGVAIAVREPRPVAGGARTPQGCFQGCAPEGPAIKWRLFHLFVRPALRQEFFFGDHTLTLLEETKEHIKRFGLDGDPLACSSQFTSFCIEFTVAEMIDHTLYPGVTASLPYPVPFFAPTRSKPSSRFSSTTVWSNFDHVGQNWSQNGLNLVKIYGLSRCIVKSKRRRQSRSREWWSEPEGVRLGRLCDAGT